MKFSVSKGELADALSVVGRALSSRSTLPILSGILVSADASGEVTLQATDLEVSVKETLSLAGVEKEGAAVLPGKLLADIVRSLPEAAVTIDVDKEMAAITCLHSSFALRILPHEDFPKFPQVESDTMVSIPAGIVKETIKHVSKAVSRDETRPVLTGILLTIDGPQLKMVATDSYRLAVKETEIEGGSSEGLEVVIPAKVLDEVARVSAGTEDISLGVAENQIVFSFGRTVFVTRRIDGSFPNYRQLIPKESETKVTMAREELTAAVKRVSILAQHNTPLRMSVRTEDQTLSLSATSHEVGDASEDLMVAVEGSDVEIAFNHIFLLDGLAAAEGDDIAIDVVSPLKPGVLTSPTDDGFLYLLMPVRLS